MHLHSRPFSSSEGVATTGSRPGGGRLMDRQRRSRQFASCALALLLGPAAHSETEQKLFVSPDSPRWTLEGQAKATDYQGRKCLLLDGGGATLNDFEMRDGVVDVDVATPANY